MSYKRVKDREYIYVMTVNGALSLFTSKTKAAKHLGISTRQLYNLTEGKGFPVYYKGAKIGQISPNKG